MDGAGVSAYRVARTASLLGGDADITSRKDQAFAREVRASEASHVTCSASKAAATLQQSLIAVATSPCTDQVTMPDGKRQHLGDVTNQRMAQAGPDGQVRNALTAAVCWWH